MNVIGRSLITSLVCIAGFFPSTNGWTQTAKLDAGSPEFSARLIWKHDGRKAKAQLFVKQDRYRIEYFGGVKTELGNAGVTIVRLDEQKVWYVISQRRMVVSVPLTSEYLLPFSVTLEGETSRTLIGDSMVNAHDALLYDVEVQDRFGKIEKFFEWVDPDRNVLLKLVSQDRDWFVEYEHVVVSSQPEYYFEAPLGYRMIEAQEAQIPNG
jgi:hypothetical protein